MSSEIGLTVGAMELGLLIASVLYGVTTVQIYIYSKSSTHDPLFVRALVRQKRYLSSTSACPNSWADHGALVRWLKLPRILPSDHAYRTLETVHTVFSWIFLYHITVTYYGDPLILQYTHWSIDISAIFNRLIGTIVQVRPRPIIQLMIVELSSFSLQSYSAYRIYIISGNLVIPMVSWIGSALRLAGSIATFTPGMLVTTFQEFGDRYQGVAIVTHVLAVCVDTLNAAAMLYLLWRAKATIKRWGFTNSRNNMLHADWSLAQICWSTSWYCGRWAGLLHVLTYSQVNAVVLPPFQKPVLLPGMCVLVPTRICCVVTDSSTTPVSLWFSY